MLINHWQYVHEHTMYRVQFIYICIAFYIWSCIYRGWSSYMGSWKGWPRGRVLWAL